MTSATDPFESLRQFYYTLNPNIPEEIWVAIVAHYHLRTIPKGSYLLQQGEICDFVGYVHQGLFRTYHLDGDKEVIFEFTEEGNLVSDYTSFMLREPSVCMIQALEDSMVLCINFEDVERLYTKSPSMYKNVGASLDRLYVSNFNKYSSVLLDDLETAYRNFLHDKPDLVPRIHQYMIASYLGVTPEALTRTRRSIGM